MSKWEREEITRQLRSGKTVSQVARCMGMLPGPVDALRVELGL